jgi:hypothetical protein
MVGCERRLGTKDRDTAGTRPIFGLEVVGESDEVVASVAVVAYDISGSSSSVGSVGVTVEVTAEELASDSSFQFRVEPRGFEPLTSAVQSQGAIIVDVRRCSKIPANKHMLP